MAVTSGRCVVDDIGFPVRLATHPTYCRRIDILAIRSNTDVVYIGDKHVVAKDGYTRGYPLYVTAGRGDIITLTDVDLSEVWIDAAVADEGVEWGPYDG